MQHYSVQELANMLMAEKKQTYNNFKREIDRKYALYSLLRYNSKPYELIYILGSNQIILKDASGNELYCNDTETDQQINHFEKWFMPIILTWLKTNHPDGRTF